MIETTDPKQIDFKRLFSLEEKVIVVVGHRGLIGSAFAEACQQFGATVVGFDLPEDDVRNEDDVISLRDDTIRKYGKIDGLVNCHHTKPEGFFDITKFIPKDDDKRAPLIGVFIKDLVILFPFIS